MASTSQQFLALLIQRRNELYGRALAGSSPEQAEAALAGAFRRAMAAGQAPGAGDSAALLEAEFPRGGVATEAEVMPADVYARLCAVIAAAGEETAAGGISGTERAMLKDPLLAPKRHKRPKEPVDGLGFSPMMRFVVAAMVALAVGVAATAKMLGWW